MILAIILIVVALIIGLAGGAKFGYSIAEDEHKAKSQAGEAHPVKVKTTPVTPKEALALQPSDLPRLDYLVGWVNGLLCKLNNETRYTDLTFVYANENRKTIDAVVDLFKSYGWQVREVMHNANKNITFRFETDERVRVTLDGTKEEIVEGTEDELAKKFEELEKKVNTK